MPGPCLGYPMIEKKGWHYINTRIEDNNRRGHDYLMKIKGKKKYLGDNKKIKKKGWLIKKKLALVLWEFELKIRIVCHVNGTSVLYIQVKSLHFGD